MSGQERLRQTGRQTDKKRDLGRSVVLSSCWAHLSPPDLSRGGAASGTWATPRTPGRVAPREARAQACRRGVCPGPAGIRRGSWPAAGTAAPTQPVLFLKALPAIPSSSVQPSCCQARGRHLRQVPEGAVASGNRGDGQGTQARGHLRGEPAQAGQRGPGPPS